MTAVTIAFLMINGGIFVLFWTLERIVRVVMPEGIEVVIRSLPFFWWGGSRPAGSADWP